MGRFAVNGALAVVVALSVPLVTFFSARCAVPPRVSAAAAVLIDYATGEVMFSRNAWTVRYPASLTKMMTALLAIEINQPDTRVTVSSKAAGTPGASFGIGKGDKPPIWKLVYGMMMRSGNDAAVALAEGVAGNEPDFVRMMNRRAKEMGLTATRFVNPHGLHDKSHVSSARDMGILARNALQNREFAKVVNTREIHTTWNGRPLGIYNINRFLYQFPGAEGIKTGYTDPAGYCLAAVASKPGARGRGPNVAAYKRGDRIICVILGAPSSWNRYDDASKLLKWGLAGGWQSGAGGARYTVRAGDTLSTIARRFGVSQASIRDANGIRNPDSLVAGTYLVIPGIR